MEEMHRTHKEPAWGWLGLALSAFARRPRHRAARDGQVVTPWSSRAPGGWSA